MATPSQPLHASPLHRRTLPRPLLHHHWFIDYLAIHRAPASRILPIHHQHRRAGHVRGKKSPRVTLSSAMASSHVTKGGSYLALPLPIAMATHPRSFKTKVRRARFRCGWVSLGD